LLSHHLNEGQNWDIKIANRSFENVSQFKYFGTTVTNQNLIQEEIKRRLSSGNDCYHSVQNQSKTIILFMVLYGWSLRVFENKGAEEVVWTKEG
jgi:hypothetical protein